eukprot:2454909-Prymnesium_polylepis.1
MPHAPSPVCGAWRPQANLAAPDGVSGHAASRPPGGGRLSGAARLRRARPVALPLDTRAQEGAA